MVGFPAEPAFEDLKNDVGLRLVSDFQLFYYNVDCDRNENYCPPTEGLFLLDSCDLENLNAICVRFTSLLRCIHMPSPREELSVSCLSAVDTQGASTRERHLDPPVIPDIYCHLKPASCPSSRRSEAIVSTSGPRSPPAQAS